MNLISKLYFLCGKIISRKVIFLFLILSLITLIELLSIGSFIPLVKSLIENNKENFLARFLLSFSFIKQENFITSLFLFILIIFTLKYFLYSYFTFFRAKFITDIRSYLSKKFFRSYLQKDLIFFLKKNTSELLRNCDQEITVLSRCLNSIITLVMEFILLLSIIIFMFNVQPIKTFVPFFLIALITYLYFRFTKSFLKKIGEQRFILQGKKIQYLQQGFGSIREIKINQNIKFYINSFVITINKIMRIIRLRMFMNEMIKPTFEILIVLAIVANAFILKFSGYTWKEIFSVLAIYGVAALRVLPLFNKILVNLQALNFNSPAIHKLYTELESSKMEEMKKNDKKISFINEIKIRNLDFSYNEKKKVFDDINFQIRKGDLIGIFGKSGSGKTTLVEIISGMIKPAKGKIYVDDNLLDFSYINWISKFSYASEKAYFLDDTLIKNITLEEDEALINNDKLKKVLELSLLSKSGDCEIDLNTKIGEIAKQLSAGQKQRLSLSRALYKSFEILIMDEATNAVDESSQNKIIENIKDYIKYNKKTCLIISHDKKVLAKCERVYEIKDGKINRI